MSVILRRPNCKCLVCDPECWAVLEKALESLGHSRSAPCTESCQSVKVCGVRLVFLDWDDTLVPTSIVKRLGPLSLGLSTDQDSEKGSGWKEWVGRITGLNLNQFEKRPTFDDLAPERDTPSWGGSHYRGGVWIITNGGRDNVVTSCVQDYNWIPGPISRYNPDSLECLGELSAPASPHKSTREQLRLQSDADGGGRAVSQIARPASVWWGYPAAADRMTLAGDFSASACVDHTAEQLVTFHGSSVTVRSTTQDNNMLQPKCSQARVQWKAKSFKKVITGELCRFLNDQTHERGGDVEGSDNSKCKVQYLMDLTVLGDESEPEIIHSLLRHLPAHLYRLKTVKTHSLVGVSEKLLPAHKTTVHQQLGSLLSESRKGTGCTMFEDILCATTDSEHEWRFDRFREVQNASRPSIDVFGQIAPVRLSPPKRSQGHALAG
eukprot:GHVN01001072.1.p1 GENE.GHVN01001072.1~~GHVN01001072.1.p1  ORF type:complete len:436 (+),score=24.44 GHVN01001072.1:147-1454(+)